MIYDLNTGWYDSSRESRRGIIRTGSTKEVEEHAVHVSRTLAKRSGATRAACESPLLMNQVLSRTRFLVKHMDSMLYLVICYMLYVICYIVICYTLPGFSPRACDKHDSMPEGRRC